MLYNASGSVECYNITSLVGPAGPGDTWLFQWCAQRAAQELPFFPATGKSDMFWYQGRLHLSQLDVSDLSACEGLWVGSCPVRCIAGSTM